MDVISSLPDDLLGTILSLLPTKQVVSTALLSKRWKNVFLLVSSLDFDSSDFSSESKFITFVTNFLKLQGSAPIRKLTLKNCLSPESDAQSWICTVLERGVVELDVSLVISSSMDLEAFSSVFKSKTLAKLKLGGNRYKIMFPEHVEVYLPMLKSLHLDSVILNGDHDVLGALATSCPVLEELVFNVDGWAVSTLSVSSPSLKKLCIQFNRTMSISLDVPNLVYFELTCGFGDTHQKFKLDSLVEARLNLRVSETLIEAVRHGNSDVIGDDMVNLINLIKNIEVLHLSSDFLELLHFSSQELPMFSNLVRLCIRKNEENRGWKNLPRLIKHAPNLKTLSYKGGLNSYVTKKKCGDACVSCESKEKISACLSTCPVKVLEILGYNRTRKEVNQVKYFLKRLPCLEVLKIRPTIPVTVDTQQLLDLPRASPNCRIQPI